MNTNLEKFSLNGDAPIVYPKKIGIELYNWCVPCSEVFVKFEKFRSDEDRIFMIGVWYLERNKDSYHNEDPYVWTYRNFLAKSYFAEYAIIEDFIEFIREMEFRRIWYWKDELNIWKNLKDKYSGIDFLDFKWVSLSIIFVSEPILVKGVLNLDFKEIGNAMYNGRIIRTVLCEEGDYDEALAFYRGSCQNDPYKDDNIYKIENYNKSFVSVFQEILQYLRRYHT